MRRASMLLLVTAAGLLCGQLGQAGPITGSDGTKPRIHANAEWTLTKSDRRLGELLKFKGGERACVVIVGDHKPVVPLVLEIRDDKGQLVGSDAPGQGMNAADAPGNDVAAVIWYPPRDGYYRITIKNQSDQYNDVWVAIK